MASNTLKKRCSKCNKNMSILTCDGCERSFCTKHIADHRQELSIEMDSIGQEYDLLRRDLIRDDNDSHLLFDRINIWERESIIKIQQIAQQARHDLRQCLDENKSQITNNCNKLADELQSNRESGDYTEIDFDLWNKQLRELRKMLEKPPIIDILEDNTLSRPIYMIKIKQKIDQQSTTQISNCNIISNQFSELPIIQNFNTFIGDAIFTDNYHVAKHSGDSQRSTMVYLTKSYLSGIHRIRFRIEQKLNKYLFFGIINSLEEMNRTIFNSPSLYGWMSPISRVVKSQKVVTNPVNTIFNECDEISLTLNCNIQQILLEHHRTDIIDRLPIDIRVCPLPWRVVIAFFSSNDSVRIIY
ncbi:unnamed protein product [Adineta steineri]|uniref:B box-type domain-containing protein n=2 Tax=Adineta steineri TaxID=433720 RepID=A0A815FHN5_9BILA|nr:unnamed protein product [Adineta steineri]CAF3836050.1 unnamed protein product [Adineta steineri]